MPRYVAAAGVLASLATVVFVIRRSSAIPRAPRTVLLALLTVLACSHLANALEWSGFSWPDVVADHLSIAVPLLWGWFLLEISRSELSQQVLASKEQLNFVLERVPASVASLSDDGRLDAFSNTWLRTFPESAAGKSLAEVLPARLPELEHSLTRCTQVGVEASSNEEASSDPSGRVRYFRWAIHCWRLADHRRTILLVLEETTASVEAEKERSRAADTLARAQRMAHLGQLAAGAAHDFNNLLHVIRLAVGELRVNPSEDEASRDLEGALEKAQSLTSAMLRFGKGSSGARGPVDLRALLSELQRLLKHGLGRRHALAVSISSEQPMMVLGNRGRLEQAILNLVTNARDAMPDGGTIELSVERSDGEALLMVRDNGVGMTDSVREHAFAPFFTTKDEKGTGLGLAVVRSAVEEHGGTVSVNSAPGGGTTFHVSLPLHHSHE